MPEGAQPGGRRAAIVAWLIKARVFILVAALLLTGVSLYALRDVHGFVPVELSGLLLVPLAAWAVGVFVLLLSFRLTAIAVVAPALGAIWWLAALSRGQGLFNIGNNFVQQFLSILVVGLIASAFQMHLLVSELARGRSREEATRASLVGVALPSLLGMLGAGCGLFAFIPDPRIAAALGTGAVLTLVAATVLPLPVASFVEFGENYVARINRERERREWLISYCAILSVPRWAFAAAGIVVVLTAIICLDQSFASLWAAAKQPFALAFAGLGILGALGLRNWRTFFSCALAGLTAAIWSAWFLVQTGLPAGEAVELALLVASAIGGVLVFFFAAPTARYQREGDPMIIAFSRALNDAGAAALILAFGAALALLTGVLVGIAPGAALLPLIAVIADLTLFPAIATALDDFFPRRKPLKELYRAR